MSQNATEAALRAVYENAFTLATWGNPDVHGKWCEPAPEVEGKPRTCTIARELHRDARAELLAARRGLLDALAVLARAKFKPPHYWRGPVKPSGWPTVDIEFEAAPDGGRPRFARVLWFPGDSELFARIASEARSEAAHVAEISRTGRAAGKPRAKKRHEPKSDGPLTNTENAAWTAVRECRSFAAAGRKLGCTRQAVTSAYRRAEAKLKAAGMSSRSVSARLALPTDRRGNAT